MTDLLAQGIIAFDISERPTDQPQCLRRRYRWCGNRLSIDQPVQQIEEVRLGRNAGVQRQLNCGQYGLLIAMQNQQRGGLRFG